LRESARREIADRQRHLANLLREGPGLNPPAVHAQRVLAARLAVESAYLDGLLDPCLQVEWNYQDAQAFALTERERTRTQGRYADPMDPYELPATVSTEVELQSQILKRERPQIYLHTIRSRATGLCPKTTPAPDISGIRTAYFAAGAIHS
jgi:hypothetical protein